MKFRVRVPDATTILRSIVGGVAMGVGAAWAGGCTIGNSMVETSQLAYQGWLAFGFTFLGVGLATRFFPAQPPPAPGADLTRPSRSRPDPPPACRVRNPDATRRRATHPKEKPIMAKHVLETGGDVCRSPHRGQAGDRHPADR